MLYVSDISIYLKTQNREGKMSCSHLPKIIMLGSGIRIFFFVNKFDNYGEYISTDTKKNCLKSLMQEQNFSLESLRFYGKLNKDIC